MDKIKESTQSMSSAVKQAQQLVSKGFDIKTFDNVPSLHYAFLLWKHVTDKKGKVTTPAYCIKIGYKEFSDFMSKSAPDFYKRYEALERQISELNTQRIGMLYKLNMAIEASGKLHEERPKQNKRGTK